MNREVSIQVGPLAGLAQRVANSISAWFTEQHRTTRRVAVGTILLVALVAFELFNYDTTEFALESLLGTVAFAGIRWATILAIAFCSIDFAGLARLIAPDGEFPAGASGLKPTTLLLGAWLLGAGMNAVMTWWAVSLALMGHSLGNEVLSREQLLRAVPVLVAVLVWVTRLLIISSLVTATGKSQRRSAGGRLTQARLRRLDIPTPRRAARAEAAPCVSSEQPTSRINGVSRRSMAGQVPARRFGGG